MTTVHTFNEAIECIEAGGAAYRYGAPFPIWAKGAKITDIFCNTYVQGNYFGIRCVNIGHITEKNYLDFFPPMFSITEQQSADWVLLSKEEFKKLVENWKEDYKKYKEERKKMYSSTANNVVQANTETPASVTSTYEPEVSTLGKLRKWIWG